MFLRRCLFLLILCFASGVAAEEPLLRLTATDSRSIAHTEAVCLVESSSPGARVFLNGVLLGETPLRVSNLASGLYPFVLEKAGCRPRTVLLEIEQGRENRYSVAMTVITGFIQYHVTPPEAAVLLDGELVRDHKAGEIREVSVGDHLVEARLFGRATKSTRVRVTEDGLARVTLDLPPVTQTLDLHPVNQRPFDPDMISRNGPLLISFAVGAPGRGVAAIFSQGREIWRTEIPRFAEWNQELRWDGRDNQGRQVGNGTYLLVVTVYGNGAAQSYAVSKEGEIRVGKHIHLFTALIPGSGTGSAKTAQILSPGVRKIGITVAPTKYWPIMEASYTEADYMPVSLFYAMSPAASWEYSLSLGVGTAKDYYVEDANPLEASVSLKRVLQKLDIWGLQNAALNWGFGLNAHFSTNSTEMPENPSGFGISFLAGFSRTVEQANWYVGYAGEVGIPLMVHDAGMKTNMAVLEASANDPDVIPPAYFSSTQGIPLSVANTVVFKWQDSQSARTVWLTMDRLIFQGGAAYLGLPASLWNASVGLEWLAKVPSQNVVFSSSVVLNYFVAKVKLGGSVGLWYYF